MRATFIKKLIELAEVDRNIFLIVGDYGYSVVEPFQERYPERFINAGISEQNIIGVAAGLALTGKKVFVYSIVTFITMRCLEQIRVDICYQNLPVCIIGVGAGFAFGPAAATHHSIEDFAIMCSLPNMSVFSPANSIEVQELLPQVYQLLGPAYLRLGRNCSETNCISYPQINIGQPVEIVPGRWIIFLVTGEVCSIALTVVDRLRKIGIDCGLMSIHTIKPLDLNFLVTKVEHLHAVFTLEEHVAVGGLGQQVASFICQNMNKKIVFKSFTLPNEYLHTIGFRDYLLKIAGIHADLIFESIIKTLNIQHHSDNMESSIYHE